MVEIHCNICIAMLVFCTEIFAAAPCADEKAEPENREKPTKVQQAELKLNRKRKSWTGAPTIPNPFGRKGKLYTFQRLPKAKDVTAIRLAPSLNRGLKPLTLANIAAVLDGMAPIKVNDPKYKLWHYAPRYDATFETAEGRFRASFYFGGLAILQAPDGSTGLVKYQHPK